MIESVLTKRKFSLKVKVTIKALISFGIIALSVVLPQLVHLIAGAPGGVKWLPMYLPVLLGGCLLGYVWGLGIGILAPVVSFGVTSAFGNPMPALTRLPFMICELAVFATISGLFSKRIVSNGWMAFPAVLLASVCGRAAFMLLVVVFQGITIPSLAPAVVWGQIQTGLLAVVIQAVIVPFIVMGINYLLKKHD